MNQVLDMGVEWFFRYGNTPDLKMVVDDYLPFDKSEWQGFPDEGGTMWISRHDPMTRFMYEPKPPQSRENTKYGGALGGQIRVGDRIHTARQCWSSSTSKVNRMRVTREGVAELLPYDLVDITCHTGRWSWGGMAGLYWDLPWAEQQLAQFLPGVKLYPVQIGGGLLDDTQMQVVGGGPLGTIWIPYPEATPGEKPDAESEFAQRTSAAARRDMQVQGR